MIKTSKDCEDAAMFLNLPSTTSYSQQYEDVPHGCIYSSSDWLIFSSPYGQIHENVPCGTSKYGNNYDCICKAPGENLLISNQIHIYVVSSTDDTYNYN